MSLQSLFTGRRVLLTGHTGFKGSWLALWLKRLGADVYGVSLDVPTDPSHFEVAGIGDVVDDRRCDVRDYQALKRLVDEVAPDFVFHLAAQSLVRRSYREPLLTMQTNILGTTNVLEVLRERNEPCVAVLITSDKCYENVEWVWGYRESDRLGGDDPYSASKGGAELVIKGYVQSYFARGTSPVRVAVARAGNVIGGGDWAEDRLIPDCVKAWSAQQPITIRFPQATRPWQHVLEPLSGYLSLAAGVSNDETLTGEPFNFGPSPDSNHSVAEVIREFGRYWDKVDWIDGSGDESIDPEAGLLKLNCDKANARLNWRPTLEFDETMKMTADWYRRFLSDKGRNMRSVTEEQIDDYTRKADETGIAWARKSP